MLCGKGPIVTAYAKLVSSCSDVSKLHGDTTMGNQQTLLRLKHQLIQEMKYKSIQHFIIGQHAVISESLFLPHLTFKI